MTHREDRALRLIVLFTVLAGFVLPIVAGLWETARAAFGILPAIGAGEWSLAPWRQLFGLPGFGTSVALTLWVGFGSTIISLLLASGLCALIHGRKWARARAGRVLAPFLAAPHAALAIGLAFLLSPSGWIARLLSPWATGWNLPPDIATVNDPMGFSLIIGLLIKEVPFLFLMMMTALTQIPAENHLRAGRALGYARGLVWIKIILPQIYPLIRLPVFVVLSFALSVVDMAIILGPSNPPTLAVAMTRWFYSADIGLLLPASAAALLQSVIVLLAIGVWLLAEGIATRIGRLWVRRGGRGMVSGPFLAVAGAVTGALMLAGALALASLLVWSFAWRWSFPGFLPESWSMQAWLRPGAGWGAAFAESFGIGLCATLISILIAIAWLEGEDRAGMRRVGWAEGLIYLPLLVPQVAFLYGLSVAMLGVGLGNGRATVIWGHVLFVFPYVMVALSDPWRALDRRMVGQAATLGAGPWRRLWAVKLPILLAPILVAAAIGFAVSVAQYLPTLFLGAGRIATLTTEAVTLSSGSDRRVVGVYAVLQAALPFASYLAAWWVPRMIYRDRAGLNGGRG